MKRMLFAAAIMPLVVQGWPGMSSNQQLAIEAARSADKLAENGDHLGAVRGLAGALRSGLPPFIASVAYYNLGASLSELKAWTDAARAYGKAAVLAQDKNKKAQAYGKRGDMLSRLGSWPEAAEAYGKAVEHSSEKGADDSSYAMNAAAAYINANNGDTALSFLHQVSIEYRNEMIYYAHLATAYSMQGQVESVLKALNQVKLTSKAVLFAAMLLESRAHDKQMAIFVLERLILHQQQLKASDPHASSVFYRLSRLYTDSKRDHEAAYIRELALRSGVWMDPFQQAAFLVPALRPTYAQNFSAAQAWITNSTVYPNSSDSCATIDSELWAPLLRLKSRLENDLFHTTLLEWREASTLQQQFSIDDEGIALNPEAWRQLVFRRNGKWLPPAHYNNTFRQTVAALHNILDTAPEELALNLPKGSAQISILRPGAQLVPHSGPSNHRIRIHLTLESDGEASITVGDPSKPTNTRYHQPGEAFIFDDSFLHSARNPVDALLPRVVLLIDVWHPALSSADREMVREHFLYDSNDVNGWQTPHPPFGPTTFGLLEGGPAEDPLSRIVL